MKAQLKLKMGILIFAIAFMPMISCSDDDSDSGPSSGGNGGNIAAESMSVKIDGTTKTFGDVFGVSTFGNITLVGSDNTTSTYPLLSISLSDTTNAGTYSLPAQGLYPAINFQKDSASILFTSGGSLEIISHDKSNKQVIGRFDVSLSQFGSSTKVNLTDGKFNISY